MVNFSGNSWKPLEFTPLIDEAGGNSLVHVAKKISMSIFSSGSNNKHKERTVISLDGTQFFGGKPNNDSFKCMRQVEGFCPKTCA